MIAIISPAQFLAATILITAGARLTFVLIRRKRRRALQDLARDWRMHYSQRDALALAARVAQHFPIPGAAEVRVVDLIYGSDGNCYRYFFRAEYTLGVTRAKYRTSRVIAWREQKGGATQTDPMPLQLAPEELPPLEQYRKLKELVDAGSI